jgi:hypothetical protein
MAVVDGKTRKGRRRQHGHPSPVSADQVAEAPVENALQVESAPPAETNTMTLENSFQEIALADSGKVMLNVFDAGPSLGDSFSSADMSGSVENAGDKPEGPANSSGIQVPTSLSEYTGTKDLLFRLIRSDYFDAWIGLNYLWKYNGKDVGLQYFLCERLRERPMSEIEFVLPQIWYTAWPGGSCLTCLGLPAIWLCSIP